MSESWRPHLSDRELVLVLEATAFIEAEKGAHWETEWFPRNPHVIVLCNHDRGQRWRNQSGRMVCGVCFPPVGTA
jgi:hypothetical protein